MEYIGGRSLRQLLRNDLRKPESWISTRKSIVIAEIVKGMKLIHSRRFLHRDLKPMNIFVDSEDTID
jgi:serine/threonine protein kinase